MKARSIAFAFLFVLVNSVKAQIKSITIDEAIATSLQNNFDIQLVKNESQLAALNYSYSDYAFFPRLNAGGSYLFNKNKQTQEFKDTTRGGTDKGSNLTTSLNLNWTLFDGMKMFITRKRLNELVKLGELQIKNQVITTVADVMLTYYDIVRQQQQLRSIEEQMDLINERLKLAQYKYEIGTGAKPDLLQAQIDLNAQRSALLNQQNVINKIKEQLNQLLVVPLNTGFSVADTTINFNNTLSLDSIQSGITNTNPQLLIARKNLDIAGLALRERKAERFPVIEFNSTYNYNIQDKQTTVNPFQALYNQNRGLNYGLSATIPIFNGFNTKRAIKAAELDIQYQQLVYDRNLTQINTSLINAYRDYDLYKRTLQLEEDNIKLVRENLFIARERYRLGISTFLEMREAQRSLEEANNRLIGARYNTKAAEIELMRLRGDLVQ